MSGGSMDYLCHLVGDARFKENTALRKLFKEHLNDVAEALHAIEWNDSGDGEDCEDELIKKCLNFNKKDVVIKLLDEQRNFIADLIKTLK